MTVNTQDFNRGKGLFDVASTTALSPSTRSTFDPHSSRTHTFHRTPIRLHLLVGLLVFSLSHLDGQVPALGGSGIFFFLTTASFMGWRFFLDFYSYSLTSWVAGEFCRWKKPCWEFLEKVGRKRGDRSFRNTKCCSEYHTGVAEDFRSGIFSSLVRQSY